MNTNINSTSRQRKAVKLLVENGGNPISISKAMLLAGYTPATAKTPQKLTESKGYKLLLEEAGISDVSISRTLSEGLDAVRDDTGTPDHATRLKYLETALRLMGYL